jgi:cell division protein ZapA
MNNDKNMLNIQLRVADLYLPMTIRREEEEYYREAAKRIDNLLNLYRDNFKEQSTERYMTMVALHLSVIAVKLERQNDTKPYQEKIEELTQVLEKYLKNE